jgi:hypothetical protein
MISLSSHELAIHDFIALISYKPIEGLDDRLQIYTLGNRIRPVLTLRTSVVIIGTFKDEAQAFWCEANVAGFSPTEKIKSKLSEAVVLTHIVHRITPTVVGIVERFGPCRFGCATTNAL